MEYTLFLLYKTYIYIYITHPSDDKDDSKFSQIFGPQLNPPRAETDLITKDMKSFEFCFYFPPQYANVQKVRKRVCVFLCLKKSKSPNIGFYFHLPFRLLFSFMWTSSIPNPRAAARSASCASMVLSTFKQVLEETHTKRCRQAFFIPIPNKHACFLCSLLWAGPLFYYMNWNLSLLENAYSFRQGFIVKCGVLFSESQHQGENEALLCSFVFFSSTLPPKLKVPLGPWPWINTTAGGKHAGHGIRLKLLKQIEF